MIIIVSIIVVLIVVVVVVVVVAVVVVVVVVISNNDNDNNRPVAWAISGAMRGTPTTASSRSPRGSGLARPALAPPIMFIVCL